MPAPSSRLAVAEAVDVILRDGTTLRLRAPARNDVDALVAFFASLSERSRYMRFHGAVRAEPRIVEPFVDPDWEERGALVGTLGDAVVALASYARLRDPGSAEVAFVVADELQGRGRGRGCSSSWRPARAPSGSSRSWPRCCRRTARCSRCSSRSASCARRRSRSSWTWRRCSRASRCRAGGAWRY